MFSRFTKENHKFKALDYRFNASRLARSRNLYPAVPQVYVYASGGN